MSETHREDGRGYDPIDDDVFSALEDRQRRYTLYVLAVHESISTEELADVVAGWTGVDEPGMVSRERRDDVYLSLVHRHLPALEQAGLLTREDEGDTVSRTNWTDRVGALVELARKEEIGCDA